jgi:tRNA nucleotidyltransferase (CCA-adding enzyme)
MSDSITRYLVGGAVRDQLLGLNVEDQDWVVVGASPDTMLALGYQAVGKDFPVFLHPKTKQEYALARTERKTGAGYKGFACFFDPSVTLEEDLKRRDLTINAMAQDEEGNVIDPYHGQRDIDGKWLRHVSDAFVDDPLRVLRVARFAAKLAHLGFQVAAETMSLMKQIVAQGELENLTAERVWQEWQKSLATRNPEVFIACLRECGALAVVIPEIDRLFGVPQPEQWHPEIDTGIHTLMVTQQAAALSQDLSVRFAATVHDLGKGVTPINEWPSHKKHCHSGQALIKQLCSRLRIPNEYRDLAIAVCDQHSNVHRASELRSSTYVKIFDKLDVWRQPERLNKVLLCCQADHAGRLGMEHHPYPQAEFFKLAYQAALSVNIKPIIDAGFQGKAIREQLTLQRASAIETVLLKLKASTPG